MPDRQTIATTVSSVILIVFIWLFIVPEPYNLVYIGKRAFYKPTGICRDGVYTFAPLPQTACFDNKGLEKWFN
jgi:hypothetical protein